jgi:hypothetical protein
MKHPKMYATKGGVEVLGSGHSGWCFEREHDLQMAEGRLEHSIDLHLLVVPHLNHDILPPILLGSYGLVARTAFGSEGAEH